MIGLGDMGAPMARRLVAAGYEVAGHDVDRARIEAAGAVPCDSAAAAVAGSSAAVVIVRTLDQVRESCLARMGSPRPAATGWTSR